MSRPSDSGALPDISTAEAYRRQIAELEARLAEAEETLAAIRSGEVDAVVVGDADDRRIFTLENADRPYRLLIEQMREGAVTLSADGVVLYCNQALADMLGVPTQQIMGAKFERFVAEVRDPLVTMIEQGGSTEITLRFSDGASVPARLSLSPLPTDDERLMCGVITDLSETQAHAREIGNAQARLAAAAARRESDERYRLILESATDYAIISTDLEERVTIWNTGAQLILGWNAEEIVGRRARMIWTPEDVAAGIPEAEMANALAKGRGEDERYHLRKDGSRFWANGLMMPLRGDDGEAIGFLKILRDRSAEREVEQARRELNATLERRVIERTAELAAANDRLQIEMVERLRTEEALRQSQKVEAIGQLTGGVAHDFNNLLTIIRSSVDLLRRREITDEKKRRYIDAISDTADRAAKLTGQLLAYARRQPLRPEIFDAAARIQDAVDMLQTTVGSRVRIGTQLDCDPCYVEADANQFETALLNMAVNARDAMNEEGDLTISVRSASELPAVRGHEPSSEAFVAVTVADTGQGIPAERLERIFEPFFTTKGVGRGTGLGLSQVIGFAKQSGGEVRVESEVGHGSAFTLFLPRVDEAVAPIGGDSAPRIDQPGDDARGRILVVEDNVEVGDFAAQLLSELGYTTARVGDAAAALALLRADAEGFDLIFSDIVMPGSMSGLDLAREIKRRWQNLPVVLTTGYSHALAERDGDADEFKLLRKPYSVEDLSHLVRTSLRGHSTRPAGRD